MKARIFDDESLLLTHDQERYTKIFFILGGLLSLWGIWQAVQMVKFLRNGIIVPAQIIESRVGVDELLKLPQHGFLPPKVLGCRHYNFFEFLVFDDPYDRACHRTILFYTRRGDRVAARKSLLPSSNSLVVTPHAQSHDLSRFAVRSLEVIYAESSPKKFVVKSFWGIWGMSFVLTVAGMICFGIALTTALGFPLVRRTIDAFRF